MSEIPRVGREEVMTVDLNGHERATLLPCLTVQPITLKETLLTLKETLFAERNLSLSNSDQRNDAVIRTSSNRKRRSRGKVACTGTYSAVYSSVCMKAPRLR